MSYLICCSGSKNLPTPNKGDINNLLYDNILSTARNTIIQAYERERNKKLNWNSTLHAYELYSGKYSKLYKQITPEKWVKQTTDVKILSALFGWVKHTDLLPSYNLTMDDTLTINGKNQSIGRYWKNTGLLLPLVNQEDMDLLFNKYRRAIHGNNNPVAKTPRITFGGWGQQQGAWLNATL